jgi:hypothetical protein
MRRSTQHPRALLSGALALCLAVTAPGCAAGLTHAQREECRALRGRMAGRAVAGIIGSVVVLGVVVVASAALGRAPNFGNLGPGRRTRRANRRAQRLAVCRAPEQEGEPGVAVAADLNSLAPGAYAPTDVPIAPGPSGPPSVTELDDVLAAHLPRVLECTPNARGVLYIDARIHGPTGTISGVALGGEGSFGVSVRCVTEALSVARVRPFEGVVDTRWAVEFAPPP